MGSVMSQAAWNTLCRLTVRLMYGLLRGGHKRWL